MRRLILLVALGFIFISLPLSSEGAAAAGASEPNWTSLVPPFIAIFLALITREVIFSLFIGVWSGAFIVYNYNPLTSFFKLIGHYIKPALADPDHAAVIIFSMMLGGMVGIISKNGGTLGVVSLVTRFAKSPRLGQITAWAMGLIIFFDDCANALIVGNTMRPITDKLKISREKLAYIVDSTSAPVACLVVSTWIGFEIGVIGDALKDTGFTEDPFMIFLFSIPFRFYPILALILVFMVAVMGRDIGGMSAAERRARKTGKVLRDGALPAADLTDLRLATAADHIPHRWINGLLPILTVIIVALLGLYLTGREAIESSGGSDFSVRNILSNASSYEALFWASLAGCALGAVLSLGQRLLNLSQVMDAWFHGVKSMLLAMVILVLAWSLGAVTKELGTAEYVVSVLGHTLAPELLPVIVFLIAAVISFATGTSWGTMAIIMPIVVPLVWALTQSNVLAAGDAQILLYGSVSSVLAGAVFGDHCSPISDTTVLSSMASACDHIDHVRTQMPYAILAAVVGMFAGDIPTAYGMHPIFSILIAVVIFYAVLRFFGKRAD